MRLSSLRPSYAARRAMQLLFTRQMPDAPWLPKAAVMLLDAWLKPGDRGLEWGSGRSTIWLARRVEHVLSVEDDARWYGHVTQQLIKNGVEHRVDYRHIECELVSGEEPDLHPYADVSDEVEKNSLDYVLVDGRIRLACMRRALPLLKPGGLLILDNANRYVPNVFGKGHTTIHLSRDTPASTAWNDLLKCLSSWRWTITSDGIWDTRMWIKPH